MKNFDPNCPTYIQRPLRIHGQVLQTGTPFDWLSHGISERRARQLFEMRKLTHLPPFISQPKTKITESPKKRAVEIDIIGDFKIVPKGNHWYDVTDFSGEKLNEKSLRKADADAFAIELDKKKRAAVNQVEVRDGE